MKKSIPAILLLIAASLVKEDLFKLKFEELKALLSKKFTAEGLLLTFSDKISTVDNSVIVQSTVTVHGDEGANVSATAVGKGSLSSDESLRVSIQNVRKEALAALLSFSVAGDADPVKEKPATIADAKPPMDNGAPAPGVNKEQNARAEQESAPAEPAKPSLPLLTKKNPNWSAIVAQAKKIGNAKEVYGNISKIFTIKEDVLSALLSEAGLS